ncbi:hypothetical protein V2J09_018386 [Rumex salicifolius]
MTSTFPTTAASPPTAIFPTVTTTFGGPTSDTTTTVNETSAGPTTVDNNTTHILVIPFPSHGHLIPLLDLTHHLLIHGGRRLSITVVVTPKNLPLLQPILSHHPSTALSALVLPFPTHPSLPAGAENTVDLPPSSFHALIAALPGLKTPVLRWFMIHPSPPSVIISDYVSQWTHPLATQLGIKRIVFSPAGGFSVAASYTVRRRFPPMPRMENGEFDENAVVRVDDLPCKTEFSCWELLPLYRAFGCTDENHDGWRREILASNIESWGFVFNTFHALDSVYLDQMKSIAGHDRVWGVGPLLPPENEVGYGPKVRGGSGPVEEVLSWLDACADGEVAYVSFGALLIPTQEQTEVVAAALEKSGVKFVWKVKEGHVDDQTYGKLPPGFEGRVAGRGLVIREWAPQVIILRHKAVGSFLTHCGWNAVLEGLSAGVAPLLAWPFVGDQHYNSKFVVEKLKVGILVGQGMSKLIPDPTELAKILADSTSGGFKEEKARAMELQKQATKAISQGGTSFKELDMFVQHLIQLPKPTSDVIRKCGRWIEEQETGDKKKKIPRHFSEKQD